MGSNAIHSASDVLARLAEHETDTVDVDGLQFRESFQVVGIEGGVQGKHNVVPDRCTVTVNRRFAPKYTPEEAEAQVRELLEGADDIEILQAQLAAPPNLTDPLVDEFVSGLSLPVRPEARVDRRGALRGDGHSRAQLRSRRSRRSRTRRASS